MEETKPTQAESFKEAYDQAVETLAKEGEEESPLEQVALESEEEVSTEQQPEQIEEAASPAAETAEDEEIPLFTAEEQAEFEQSEPEQQLAMMNRAFTQKTQALSEERKNVAIYVCDCWCW